MHDDSNSEQGAASLKTLKKGIQRTHAKAVAGELTSEEYINELMGQRNKCLQEAIFWHKYSGALTNAFNELANVATPMYEPLAPIPALESIASDKSKYLQGCQHPFARRHFEAVGLL